MTTRADSPCGYCGRPFYRDLLGRAGAPFCDECYEDRVKAFMEKNPITPIEFDPAVLQDLNAKV